MYNLHHNNLPFALSVYCHKPQHRYATRYNTSLNYVLPPVSTNRGQGSIKFSGPKAWADTPKDFKEIPFRKTFTRKMKEHILADIFVELPPETNSTVDNDELDLFDLFEADDEDFIFEGF